VNLCYVRLSLLYSDVIYYISCCNTIMPLKCDSARKIMDDSGFPRTPDRLLNFCGTHVWWLEVFKTITSTCGPYYLGGSATVCVANPGGPIEILARSSELIWSGFLFQVYIIVKYNNAVWFSAKPTTTLAQHIGTLVGWNTSIQANIRWHSRNRIG
jgi:hypothetical protein